MGQEVGKWLLGVKVLAGAGGRGEAAGDQGVGARAKVLGQEGGGRGGGQQRERRTDMGKPGE